jgi:CotH kinase protein
MRHLQKTQYYILQIFLLIIVGFSGCKSVEEPEGEIVISTLKIEAIKNNSVLSNDLIGEIDGSKITFTLPGGVELKDVFVTCTFVGEGIYINNVKIDNSASKTNIINGTIIQVRSKSKKNLDYTVVFKELEDKELSISSFVLEKKNNPQLNSDVIFEINGNTIVGNLNQNFNNVIPTFTSNSPIIEVNGKSQISAKSSIDLKQTVIYSLTSSKGFKRQYTLRINWDNSLPQINITTTGGVRITSTDVYVQANIVIDGKAIYSNYSGTTKIRGRGNTTWDYNPKKPYRLKLDTKASLFGLSAEKDWVLLANYLDGLHILNAVAMKTGKLLNIPYTNNIIPVEVTLNGEYLGAYMFTEQVEVESNRVNVGADGLLLELDQNYDDPWKFKSANYNLPVMVKFPDLTNQSELQSIKNQFEILEKLVANSNFPNNNYLDYINDESIVNYLIVYMLTDNQEINHPKSTFMHKTKTGKFSMGPIWDFDWAYGYEKNIAYFNSSSTSRSLFWSPSSEGTRFFSRFITDPKIKSLLKQRWSDFRKNKFEELLTFINDYSFVIEGARNRDYQKWKRGGADFKNDINSLKTWLQNRSYYLDSYIGGL